MLRRWLVTLTALLVPVGIAGAEDPEAESQRVVTRFDLASYFGLPVVAGPMLLAPSDRLGEGDVPDLWSLSDRAGEEHRREVWVGFEMGDSDRCLSVDSLIELLKSVAPPAADAVDLESESGHVLWARGSRRDVERVREQLAWALDTTAPSADLVAALHGGDEGSVLAAGRARLYPGRWTRVWFQEQRPLVTVDYNVEIAQECTATHPFVVPLSAGQELYARWLPGETTSLVELWSGDLEHLDEVVVDLTALRNVPESSGPGTVRIPRTSIRRAYTAVLLPPGGSTVLAWRGPEGGRRLRVELRGVTASAAPQAQEDFRVGGLRTGAIGSGLLFDARAVPGDLAEELYRVLPPNTEARLSPVPETGSCLLIAQAVAPAYEALRAHVVREEAGLTSATLKLRSVTVPEEALRQAFAQGTLAVGEPAATAALESLRKAGAVDGQALELPLLVGAKAGFRLGQSVPGLVRVQVEVAQQSGAVDASTGVRFAGLAGEAVLSRSPSGLVLRLDATLSWADPKGGTTEVVLRPPVGMAFSQERPQPELDAARRVSLPTLSGATAEVFATHPVVPGEGGERLAGMVVHGGEAVLLLVAVETKPTPRR